MLSSPPPAPAWPSGFGDEQAAAAYAASRIDYHNDPLVAQLMVDAGVKMLKL